MSAELGQALCGPVDFSEEVAGGPIGGVQSSERTPKRGCEPVRALYPARVWKSASIWNTTEVSEAVVVDVVSHHRHKWLSGENKEKSHPPNEECFRFSSILASIKRCLGIVVSGALSPFMKRWTLPYPLHVQRGGGHQPRFSNVLEGDSTSAAKITSLFAAVFSLQ